MKVQHVPKPLSEDEQKERLLRLKAEMKRQLEWVKKALRRKPSGTMRCKAA